MSELNRWIIAGLGNPGRKYGFTRHNIGFMVIDRIGEKCGIELTQKKFDNQFGVGAIENNQVVLTKPQAFMNLSGPPIFQLSTFFKVPFEHVLAIHDDIDLILGQIKIKAKGGHGGHNGIKSMIGAFGSGDFPRIRIGIGRPAEKVEVTDHVLSKFSPEEFKFIQPILMDATNAAIMIIAKSLTESMNHFNKKPVQLLNL